ncbi:MAG TPA: Tol-Pal system beta propeller repeat protein TolB [Macromonas sp.]|nr:Tol-Pal system beta propeller repeat protein TolB [Macromonas sp.]
MNSLFSPQRAHPVQQGQIGRRHLLAGLAATGLLFSPVSQALAQFRIEVSGVGLKQIPFAIAPFKGGAQAPQDVSAIVQADLERSGLFRSAAPGNQVLDENSRPDLTPWRERTVDALLTGSVNRLADGRYDVRFRLWDVVRAQDLGGMSFPVAASELRFTAHRIADYIYEKLIGEPGVFSTRIAYVAKQDARYGLWVADADGENAQLAFGSPEPIISPVWGPNGAQIAYVSFESRKPVIYTHDVATGRRRLVANFKGSNSAPAWSPDGRQLLMTLTLPGNSQIYSMSTGGGEPQRLTQSGSIDTEPVYAPDGKTIYFVSDRGGSPQIYRMSPGGRDVARVTFEGNYNISPAISPDGRWMAFVSRVGGAFKLQVMELASGTVTALTDTVADESPSFAPNGRLIIYATKYQGREALMTTTLDGRIKTRLASVPGDIREPAWGPYLR